MARLVRSSECPMAASAPSASSPATAAACQPISTTRCRCGCSLARSTTGWPPSPTTPWRCCWPASPTPTSMEACRVSRAANSPHDNDEQPSQLLWMQGDALGRRWTVDPPIVRRSARSLDFAGRVGAGINWPHLCSISWPQRWKFPPASYKPLQNLGSGAWRAPKRPVGALRHRKTWPPHQTRACGTHKSL